VDVSVPRFEVVQGLEVRVMLPVLLVTVMALVNVEVNVIVVLSEVVMLPLDERVADVPMDVVEFM